KLQPLSLTDLEFPRYGFTPIPVSRSHNAALTNIPVSSQGGHNESRRVEVVRQRTAIAVWAGEHLIGTLCCAVALKSIKSLIIADEHSERGATSLLIDR